MAAPLTEAVIQRIRDQIASGALGPGSRLPPEAELATELGASRNTLREAVSALVAARVLDVRRGDGTYVTSLRPDLLLGGIGAALDLIEEGFSLELIAVRRILEPAATALAAVRIDDAGIVALAACLDRMRQAGSEADRIQHDAEFHRLVAETSGNATLASMLNAVSSRTVRARAWRGVLDEEARARTITQHDDILRALQARDATRAEAAALVHVATTESWFRDAADGRRPTGLQPGDGATAARTTNGRRRR
jgi:GntR family transcriptional repressor for pyruvate dehydrogenase complex